ncbi:MAG TPA: extracellular solute-binding protein [Parcubacteria group bacterium]|nr:extracellular solute-binding protein [Parcubacteria group bacterium]
MSKFQIVLLVVFGAFIVIAVILFSQNRGSGTSKTNITIWGSLSAYDFSDLVSTAGLSKDGTFSYNYVEKAESTLSKDFTDALAVGKGPDLIILGVDSIMSESEKLMLIPNESVRPADFANTFISEAKLFQTTLGTYALPLYVDPMVMYWNREMFARASLAVPPVYWDQIYTYITKLTNKDGAGNITQSAMALGEAKNIPHVKEIMTLLLLQAGTPITAFAGENLRSTLLESNGGAQIPSLSALEFYTQFANPQKSYYSWNRSQVSAENHFTSGKSAMYLGFASELPTLKAKNPTMDIGVSPVPQSRASGKSITSGKLYGIALVRSTRDPAGALAGALALVSKESASALTSITPVVPARRDLLAQPPTDPAGFTFYGAALQSDWWRDPEPKATRKIFVDMVESVTSGRARVDEAVSAANTALNNLLEK